MKQTGKTSKMTYKVLTEQAILKNMIQTGKSNFIEFTQHIMLTNTKIKKNMYLKIYMLNIGPTKVILSNI